MEQSRLDNLNFKAGIFTNFSQDHLDYHKSMKAYLNAKLILFSKLLTKKSLIISDKSNKQFSILKRISKKKNLRLLDISKIINQIKDVSKPLSSSFQKKNLSMAILAAQLCGLKSSNIHNTLKKIRNVNGRLN